MSAEIIATLQSPSPASLKPASTLEQVTYPLKDTLLPLIEEIDNLPPFSSPFPTRHPVTKRRLIPFHATLDDFKRKLPPMGLIRAEIIPELQGLKGLSISTLIVKKSGGGSGSSRSGSKAASPTEEDPEEAYAREEGHLEVVSHSKIRVQLTPSGKKEDETPDSTTHSTSKPRSVQALLSPRVSAQGSLNVDAEAEGEGEGDEELPNAEEGPSESKVKSIVETPGNKPATAVAADSHTESRAEPDRKSLTFRRGSKDQVRYQAIVLCVFFSDEINAGGYKARTELMQGLARRWKDGGKFPDVTKQWCNEPFPVYCSPHSAIWSSKKFASTDPAEANKSRRPFGNVAFEFERPMMQLIGFTPFGTHLTAYEGKGDNMKLWISRRSATRSDWPSKLDSTVAGGMPAGVTALENIIIECSEEAGWPEEMIRKHARCTGMVSFYKCLKSNFVVPGEYTYDMDLRLGEYQPPRPDFKEADKFMLMPVQDVLTALRNHQFKPLSALVTIDFLIRHGYITPENEANYFEIVRRCHRSTGLAGPGL
ncbi:hypothetical protein I316_05120 [Kwoniella heveanensis BCC8398]|uniref:Uncharacterized protein n=1 Tax=Kwoniella heveanensis BCC8398 TaxID=1296120 RepID=A0A1B9GQG2_9TREE|nr:hypothetical protein I316_05120 [Kwoniella heveanensis BCC8398]